MKTFKELTNEAMDKKEEMVQTILRLWSQAVDIEDIVSQTGRPVSFIKNVLKRAGKRGWEEL